MCRLAAWLGSDVALEDIIVKPTHSLIEQSQNANEAKLAVNGDGFGFAWYDEHGKLGLYRDVLPAWTDGNLPCLAAMIRSKLFVAHVRASTFGPVSRSNCHPFTSGRWSFVHNGQIADFGSCKRQLEATLSDDRYVERAGNTDSELMFLLLLDNGLDEDVQGACEKVLTLLAQATEDSDKPTRIASVFSDGDHLYALRFSSDTNSPSLYVSRREQGDLMMASEPLDDTSDTWDPVPESTLLIADNSDIASHTINI